MNLSEYSETRNLDNAGGTVNARLTQIKVFEVKLETLLDG